MIVERRADLLGGGEHDRRRLADQIERGAERVDGQDLGDARALAVLLGGDLRQLAVLERELGGGVELDPLGLAERALGEGREPADRLDLVAEQLQPSGPILGRAEDVEDVAADRELTAVLDLVDTLVAGLDEQLGDVAEVDLLTAMKDEALGTKRGVGHRLGQCHGRGDDHRLIVSGRGRGRERIERADAQADEMRRRRQMRLVAGAARRVVANPPRGQIGAERPGEVASANVVGGDDQRRPIGERLVGIEQGGQQIRPDRARSAQVDRVAGLDLGRDGGESLVVERDVE